AADEPAHDAADHGPDARADRRADRAAEPGASLGTRPRAGGGRRTLRGRAADLGGRVERRVRRVLLPLVPGGDPGGGDEGGAAGPLAGRLPPAPDIAVVGVGVPALVRGHAGLEAIPEVQARRAGEPPVDSRLETAVPGGDQQRGAGTEGEPAEP